MVDKDEALAPDGEAGETIVVDRSVPEDHTVVVDRSAPEDHTVVVDRSVPEDRTVVVDRSVPEDHTVVVDRSVPEDHTVVVDRSAPDGGTVVIARGRNRAKSSSILGDLPRRGKRRELTPAPGGANRSAVLASGPGAVTAYSPRAIPAPPAAAPEVILGPESTRADAPSMPSVAKSTRRGTLVALGSFAAALVVSLVGLVILIVVLTAG